MSTLTQEIIEICESLPEENVAAVAKFARALREGGQLPGDAAWERIIAETGPRPKLDEFMRKAFADGDDEPLDAARL